MFGLKPRRDHMYMATVKNPYLEYAIYCTFKCGEASAAIGGLVLHPLYRLYLTKTQDPKTVTNNTPLVIRNLCRKLQGRVFLFGLAAGPLVSFAVVSNMRWSRMELAEKCYAIRCDNDTMTFDRSFVAFGLLGWYWKRFQGAVDFVNLSFVYFIVQKTLLAKYTTPALPSYVPEEKRFKSVQEATANSDRLTSFLYRSEKKE